MIRLLNQVLKDTVMTALVEHIDTLKEGGWVMSNKKQGMNRIMAGFPIVLGVVLYVLDHEFMSRMFLPGAAQPAGWLMTAAVFTLAITSYMVQRKLIILSNLPVSSDQNVMGAVSRIAHRGKGFLITCNILFLVPALLLVLLGPAAMTVLGAGF
jgi:hypothetical protein